MDNTADEEIRTTVFFDGSCPLCRREIAWYRRLRGADHIDWVDVASTQACSVAPGLRTEEALRRFHIRLPDGRFVSGGSAFAELWARLPAFALLGRLCRTRAVRPLLEYAYRAFLGVRPWLQRLAGPVPAGRTDYPKWLERELRSDHAGETGAVAIYRGILAVSRNTEVRDFAARHLETELRHLAAMEQIVSADRRSRLLALWRAAGFATGALPALFGPRAVYVTIDAVESFVDRHYGGQLDALADHYEWCELREVLDACRRDELAHRDEARGAAGSPPGLIARAWARVVDLGSIAGVVIARRV